jgi:rhamnose utilization protein RhaD (predicted bifunctional aldolase and dehydrogenase)
VALNASVARKALARGEERVPEEAVVAGPRNLRPSIETSLHLGLPQPCVAHVHSVGALAWAIRADAEARLGERLDGLPWAFVPYARPGPPLAEALAREVDPAAPPSAVVLARHGVVVAGETWPEVEATLEELEARLGLEPRRPARTDPAAQSPAPEGWRWLESDRLDALARDPVARAWAGAGSYYPDHVVFLGHAAHVCDVPELALADRERSKLAIVPGRGCLLAEGAGRGALEMAEALAEVLLRVPPGTELDPLRPEEEAAVLGMEAEAYRQRLAAE